MQPDESATPHRTSDHSANADLARPSCVADVLSAHVLSRQRHNLKLKYHPAGGGGGGGGGSPEAYLGLVAMMRLARLEF